MVRPSRRNCPLLEGTISCQLVITQLRRDVLIKLTEEMVELINNARESGNPCIIATASTDGTPNCGYIGTVLKIDDSSFIYRDRSGRSPLEHVEENAKVILLFRHAEKQTGWKFRCTSHVHRKGSVYDNAIDAFGCGAAHYTVAHIAQHPFRISNLWITPATPTGRGCAQTKWFVMPHRIFGRFDSLSTYKVQLHTAYLASLPTGGSET